MQNILILASNPSAVPVADALRRELDLAVEVAADRRAGLAALRSSSYALVLLDEVLVDLQTEAADLLYSAAGATPVLEMNFAITSVPRAVRQARAALARRAQDEASARAGAAEQLQNELNASLAGLLLESELALREAPPALESKLRHVVELAGDMRSRLRS